MATLKNFSRMDAKVQEVRRGSLGSSTEFAFVFWDFSFVSLVKLPKTW